MIMDDYGYHVAWYVGSYLDYEEDTSTQIAYQKPKMLV